MITFHVETSGDRLILDMTENGLPVPPERFDTIQRALDNPFVQVVLTEAIKQLEER